MKRVILSSCNVPICIFEYCAVKPNFVVIIASAMGVKQEFYQNFAQFLANSGVSVLTFDYSGIGHSLYGPIKNLQVNAADWGRNDLEQVIQYAQFSYPKAKHIIIGHSIGGQLIGLAKSSYKLDKIILVSSQSGFWKYWEGLDRLKMFFKLFILLPLIVNITGYLRTKGINRLENIPKNVATQWRKWCLCSDYLLGDKNITTYYSDIHVKISAYSIKDDKLAPFASVRALLNFYGGKDKKVIKLDPADYGLSEIGHFGVFKKYSSASLWPEFMKEILS